MIICGQTILLKPDVKRANRTATLAANANSVVHCWIQMTKHFQFNLSLMKTAFLTDIICGERFLPHKPSETLKIRRRDQINHEMLV